MIESLRPAWPIHHPARPILGGSSKPLTLSAATDKNLRALHSNFVAAHAISTSVGSLAVSHIEGQIMPGAGHDAPFQPSFSQWAAFVRADVVDREELAVYIEDSDLFSTYVYN